MSKDVWQTLALTLAPGFTVERVWLLISSAFSSVA